LRVFLDTNVLVAAFATRGLCADVFRLAAAEHQLLIGEPVLVEVGRILASKFGMPRAARNEVLGILRRFPLAAAAKEPIPLGINDPADEWIVACALGAAAEIFVTGDKALLGLHKMRNMIIVSPRQFWTQAQPAS
jgi:predicted nucleic acid-binding protein